MAEEKDLATMAGEIASVVVSELRRWQTPSWSSDWEQDAHQAAALQTVEVVRANREARDLSGYSYVAARRSAVRAIRPNPRLVFVDDIASVPVESDFDDRPRQQQIRALACAVLELTDGKGRRYLCAQFGLNGEPERTPREIARSLDVPVREVYRAMPSLRKQVRRHQPIWRTWRAIHE